MSTEVINFNDFMSKQYKEKNIKMNKVFIKQNLNKGVSKAEIRKRNIQLLVKAGLVTLVCGYLTMPEDVVLASTTETPVINQPINEVPNFLQDPSVVISWSLKVALVGMGIGFGSAILLYITQGIIKMLGQREKAKEWRRNIIDGFIEVLIAIPTILAIYYIAVTLFQHLGIFGNLL